MTLRYRATRMYMTKRRIPCCSESFKEFKKGMTDSLEIRVEGHWIQYKKPPRDYQNYTHTLGPSAIRKYFPHKLYMIR